MSRPTVARWIVAAASMASIGLSGSLPSSHAAPPAVALIASEPGANVSDVVLASPGTSKVAVVGSISHTRDAVTRAVVMPASLIVMAVTDIYDMREPSWAAALVRVEPRATTRTLVDRVYHASRPLVVDEHHVVVQRGRAGNVARNSEGRLLMREDLLSVDEVDVDTGAARVLHAWSGYETHVAGLNGDEVLIHRVGPRGGDLIGVARGSLKVRTIVPSWPAMARDFSVDHETATLIVQQWDASTRTRTVERVELGSGARTVVARGPTDLVPHAWPGGGVFLQPERGEGARVQGGRGGLQLPQTNSTLWVRAESADHAWVAALALRQSTLPEAWVLRTRDGHSLRVPVPASKRVEVAGFVGGEP